MDNVKITIESKNNVITFEKRCEDVVDFLHIFRSILFAYHFDQSIIDQVMENEFDERPQELLTAIGLFEDVNNALKKYCKDEALNVQFENWLKRVKLLNINQ